MDKICSWEHSQCKVILSADIKAPQQIRAPGAECEEREEKKIEIEEPYSSLPEFRSKKFPEFRSKKFYCRRLCRTKSFGDERWFYIFTKKTCECEFGCKK